MNKLLFSAGCAFFLFLGGCSPSTAPKQETKKAEEKPAEPVTGRFAIQQVFPAARAWAPDVEVMRVDSINLPGVKVERGKAPAWRATFVSQRLAKAKSWTYSVVESEGNLHKGPFAGLEESWSGPRGVTRPFNILAIKVDSDAAYETALKKGAAYDKKNPDKPITFLLEATTKHPDPAWRVIWGESAGTSNFSILVDASTGLYLETLR